MTIDRENYGDDFVQYMEAVLASFDLDQEEARATRADDIQKAKEWACIDDPDCRYPQLVQAGCIAGFLIARGVLVGAAWGIGYEEAGLDIHGNPLSEAA